MRFLAPLLVTALTLCVPLTARAQEQSTPYSPRSVPRFRVSLTTPAFLNLTYDLNPERSEGPRRAIWYVYGESFFGFANGVGGGVRSSGATYFGASLGANSIRNVFGGLASALGEKDVRAWEYFGGARAYVGWQKDRAFAEVGLGAFAFNSTIQPYPHLALGMRF